MPQALVKFRVRQGTAAEWTATNPVLAAGEPGYETDTSKIKYGDGVRNWVTLPYATGVALSSTAPSAVGVASAGASVTAARADHSHALPANLTVQNVSATGSASVGGSLTVGGSLIGGVHRHLASEIDDLSLAIFSQISSSIKAGSNVMAVVDSSAKTITISSVTAGTIPLSIASDPGDVTASDGSALFAARAIGGSGPISYQWQSSGDGGVSWLEVSGATGSALALTGLDGDADGRKYRLRASSGGEVVYSLAATVSIVAVSITAQPPDVSVAVREIVTLSVTASAGSSAVSYQWQSRENSTKEWADIREATTSSYSFTAGLVGTSQYRAVASSRGLNAYSRTSVVTVRSQQLLFTLNPQDTRDTGGAATFTAVTSGGGEPVAYRWQRLNGASATWSSTDSFADIPTGTSGVSGETTTTLALTGQTSAQHTRQYRLRAADAAGVVAFSGAAVLSTKSLAITLNPLDYLALAGATLPSTAFSAEGTADGGVTYQWQKSTNAGATWTNISGATSATYGGVVAAYSDDGSRYRCGVTGDGETLYTTSASLSVAPTAISITTHPSNATTSGGSASFTFAYTGGPSGTPTISWQQRTLDGGDSSWSTIAGATTTTLSMTGLTISSNGYSVRGVVKNGAAIAYTNPATVTVPGVLFTLQPASATVIAGQAAIFEIDYNAIACPTPTIAWQERAGSSGAWSSLGASGKTLTLSSLTTASTGKQYRSGVTCSGQTSYSAIATLTVLPPPLAISVQPQDVSTALGQAAFTFAHTGGDGSSPVIRWERLYSGQLAGAWSTIPGASGLSYVLTGITTQITGSQYRAVVTVGGETVTTRGAVLTVTGTTITLNPVDAVAVKGAAAFSMDFSGTLCPNAIIQWERRPSANTFWGPVAGATSKLLSLTALTSSNSGSLYRASVTCGDVTVYSSEATLTVPAYQYFFTQPASRSVKAGETVTFTYQGVFTAAQYPARWQVRKVGATEWTYQTAEGKSEQSFSFAANPMVHHNTEWRVEISLPSDKVYSDIALLTVNKTTSIKTVDLPGSSDLIGIAYAKGAFVAITSDETGMVRRSTNGGDTWNYSFLPASRYWDGIVSTSSGALIAYSSGDSGQYGRSFSTASGYKWVASSEAPPQTGVAVRSLDGGATWQSLPLGFFVGSRMRMWSFPYQNAVVAFFHGDTIETLPAAQYGNGRSPRFGEYRMAWSFDDGSSWSVADMPRVSSANAGWITDKIRDTRCPDIVGAAISPSGMMVLTSRYQDYLYSHFASGTPVDSPLSNLWTGWMQTAGYGLYIVGSTERGGVLLYRNLSASGWGTPFVAATSTVGVSTGVSARTITRDITSPWRVR